MHESEVMVNDLILFYGNNGSLNGNPHWYVHRLTVDWFDHLWRHNEVDKKLESYGIRIDEPQIGDSKPIRLSETILMDNHWHYNEKYEVWVHTDNDGDEDLDFVIKVRTYKGMSTSLYEDYPIVFVCYVHQLQQALRLVGCNKLADEMVVNSIKEEN